MEQRRSDDGGILRELAKSVPLADREVGAVVNELVAEIEHLRALAERSGLIDEPDLRRGGSVERLGALLVEQASQLQALQARLQRVLALCDLSEWAFQTTASAAEASVRVSDIRRALTANPDDAL